MVKSPIIAQNDDEEMAVSCISSYMIMNIATSVSNIIVCISWNCICVNKKVKQVNAAFRKESIILIMIICKPPDKNSWLFYVHD